MSLKKIVRGSFHQGDLRFSDMAGKQCMCNALFSICYSAFKKVKFWRTWDLNYILTAGDDLYRNIATSDFLNVDELPQCLTFEGEVINIQKIKLEGGIMICGGQEQFLVDSYW